MAVPAPRRFLRACATHRPKHTNKQAKLENGKIRIPFFLIHGNWEFLWLVPWWRDGEEGTNFRGMELFGGFG